MTIFHEKTKAEQSLLLARTPWGDDDFALSKTTGKFPALTKYSGNPIISGIEGTLNQAGYVSVINAKETFQNPIDNFYAYWAGHDGGEIQLSTAPHPLGPWTHWGTTYTLAEAGGGTGVRPHISSPEVIPIPELGVARMYYHRGVINEQGYDVQDTDYAHALLTSNGTVWTFQGEVVGCPVDGRFDSTEASYLRILRVGQKYLMTWQGREYYLNAKSIGFMISDDGITGVRSRVPLFYNKCFKEQYGPTGDIGGTPNLIEVNGILWFFFVDGNTNRKIKAIPLFDLYEKNPRVDLILEATQAWETGYSGLESPSFLMYEGVLYVYYNNLDITGNEGFQRKIGVAYADLRGVK